MTANIIIANATIQNFQLFDSDNNNYGMILANQKYSLPLKYSDTFEKQYNLIFFGGGGFLTFWLSINGEIIRVAVYNQPFSLLIQNGTSLRKQLFNKLKITPQSNTFATVPPTFSRPVPDGVLRLDFRG